MLDLVFIFLISICFLFNPFFIGTFFFNSIFHHFIDRDFVNLLDHGLKRFDHVGLNLFFFQIFFYNWFLLISLFYEVILISCVIPWVSSVNQTLHEPIFFLIYLLLLLSIFYYIIKLIKILYFSCSLKTHLSFKY
jgi:hypothetical protein